MLQAFLFLPRWVVSAGHTTPGLPNTASQEVETVVEGLTAPKSSLGRASRSEGADVVLGVAPVLWGSFHQCGHIRNGAVPWWEDTATLVSTRSTLSQPHTTVLGSPPLGIPRAQATASWRRGVFVLTTQGFLAGEFPGEPAQGCASVGDAAASQVRCNLHAASSSSGEL